MLVAGIDTQSDRVQFFLDGNSELNGKGGPPLHKCLIFLEQYACFGRMIRHEGLAKLVQSKNVIHFFPLGHMAGKRLLRQCWKGFCMSAAQLTTLRAFND